MSWFKRSFLCAAVWCLILSASGCGFRPLYGTYSEAPAVLQEMAAIKILPIADREGQILRNFLEERLGSSLQTAERYRLNVTLSLVAVDQGIRKDDNATRQRLTITATYNLADSSGKVLTTGSSRSISGYDLLEARFATVIAERDAQERGLRDIAEDIKAQLSIFFATRQGKGQSGSGALP